MDAIKLIEVKEDILADNDVAARELRKKLKAQKTLMINLMASPGAGKTSLLLQTISALKNVFRMAVIEADIDSTVDAEKIAKTGIESIQLRTGGFCHLDVAMVTKGLEAIDTPSLDLIFIENVGNLVCPAEFDTGAEKDIMILSVPEGDDKPHKYPLMFTESDVVLVNKIDVLPYFDFSISAFSKAVCGLNPSARILPVSAKSGEGLEAWFSWLENELKQKGGAT